MKINNNNQTSFQAKFFYSRSLKRTAQRAVEKGKFEKLNTARKNIDKAFLTRRLLVDAFENDNGGATVKITRFLPKKHVLVAQNGNDYYLDKTITFETDKKCCPYDFALKILIKLGNNAPHNKLYKKVVINK